MSAGETTGSAPETIDLTSCKVDKAGGSVTLDLKVTSTEELVKTEKESLAKGASKGTIGGFYKKRGATEGADNIKGIWGEKDIASFDFSEAGAFAFSMAGAIAAAALAF